jgi:hypothetical protein
MAKTMPNQNEREGNAENLVEAFLETELDALLQHELMNETRDYVERGRRLQTLSSAGIFNSWVVGFERWFETAGNSRDMDDAAAEIRLRGLKMPYERVKNKIRALRTELASLDPKNRSSPQIHRKINDYLVARSKPKN